MVAPGEGAVIWQPRMQECTHYSHLQKKHALLLLRESQADDRGEGNPKPQKDLPFEHQRWACHTEVWDLGNMSLTQVPHLHSAQEQKGLAPPPKREKGKESNWVPSTVSNDF